jgi:hypothetical protein
MSNRRRKPQNAQVKGRVIGAPMGYPTESNPIDATHGGQTWSKILRDYNRNLALKRELRQVEKDSLRWRVWHYKLEL